MDTRELLSQLSDLEGKLKSFSYEELSLEEASRLKNSFSHFKDRLEEKVYNPKANWNPDGYVIGVQGEEGKADNQREDLALVAKVSHELRTPLNGILGFTQLLSETELNPEQNEFLKAIKVASFNLLDLVNELMEYTQLGQGMVPAEQVEFNPFSIVRNAMYLCNTLILGKEVRLEIDIDPNIPEAVIGDPSKLSQVLLNLLGNAIKFVTEGEICLKVSLEKHLEDYVELDFQVSDTGSGIAKEDLVKIFEPYSQGSKERSANVGGYGLGLSIVKEIIENQNGSLAVASRPGVGTTFTFSLPYRVKGNSKAKSDSNTSETVSLKDIRKIAGTKVLVVEDNPMNGELLLKRLDAWDCEVFLAPNAEDALKLLTIQEIDLVLMDLRMPGINGFEATERIRNHVLEHIRKVPVIAVTADFGIKDREACEAYGIQDYLLKPYSAKELMGKLCWAKTYNEDMETRESGAFSLEGGMPSDNGTALDLKAVLEECMGDKILLAELVRLFKQNCLEFIGKTRIALDNGDMESIAQGCHKIKAGLAMLKVHNLHKLVCQLQPACEQEPDVKHIKFLYGCFVEEFPLVSAALDRKMAELGM